jgi:O-antigen/teichoic acid export membrane protein
MRLFSGDGEGMRGLAMGVALPSLRRNSSGFARHAFALGSGNALAQLIVVGFSPLIAYLYSPAAFGLFAAYLAMQHMLVALATGQYEAALMLPRRNRQAACLLLFVLLLCPGIALGAGLLLVLIGDEVAALMGVPRLAVWLWVLPVSIVMAGWYQALRFWAMRREAFADVAHNAVTRASVGTALACLLGVWSPFPGAPESGLILSQILADGFGNLLLVYRIRDRDQAVFAWPGWRRLLAAGRRWRALALSLTSAQGIAKCYSNLPVLAVAGLFGPAAAGYYALAERFAVLPAQLVANAVGDVYRQRATVEYHRHGRFDGLMRRTLAATLMIALVPFALGILLAPSLFAWVFGEVWREAGSLAQILMVGSFVAFVITPVDKADVICQRTRYILLWHAARLGLKLGAVGLTALVGLALTTLLWLIVLVRVGLYGVDLVYCYWLAKGGHIAARPIAASLPRRS